MLGVPDAVSLTLLVLTGVLMVRLMYRAHRLVQWLPVLSRGRRTDDVRLEDLAR
jgi:hypothetical protein